MENKMFCFQCQETAGCTGCTKFGVCGKSPDLARMQDLLIYTTKGLSQVTTRLREEGKEVSGEINHLITINLFTTITNANFDDAVFYARVKETLATKEALLAKLENKENLSEAALWNATSNEEMDVKVGILSKIKDAILGSGKEEIDSDIDRLLDEKSTEVGVLATKDEDVRSLRELIIYGLKGMSAYMKHANALGYDSEDINAFMQATLAKTLDDSLSIDELIALTLETGKVGVDGMALLDSANTGTYGHPEITKVNIGVRNNPGILVSGHDLKDLELLGVLATKDEDVRSLRELIIYGLKGMSAYMKHANALGYDSEDINAFMQATLAKTLDDSLSIDELIALTLETGKVGVDGMALLDSANTGTYGHPEITKVNIGVRNNPGILVSGHDLKDLELLLKQTEGTGVDVYTHSEMLPAHYYPAFKKYSHFAGNYGNAWWKQKEEFESFNGPILMTTNCIVPPKDSYKDRIYTTGAAGFVGVKHIKGISEDNKDFSEIIEQAKKCAPPTEIETGEIVGGFAHNQVFALADAVVDAVKTGAIKKFFVMAGITQHLRSILILQETMEMLGGNKKKNLKASMVQY